MQVGDIQFINNYTILHSRTGFVDGPAPERKRHMLRLWLKFPKPWPLSDEFPTHMGYKPSQDPAAVRGAWPAARGRGHLSVVLVVPGRHI